MTKPYKPRDISQAQARENRDTALAAGRTTYQGRECHNGHSGERYCASKECVACARARGSKPHSVAKVAGGKKPAEIALPVVDHGWMRPLTRAELMSGRASVAQVAA
jgi:hypothetical protein